MIRVVGFPSDETACSWQRLYLPLHFARAQGLCDATFYWKADEAACNADVMVYQRHYRQGPLVWWREMLHRRQAGHQAPALVWEMDDDVWAIPDSNPFKSHYTLGVLAAIDEMVKTADLAIVPSNGLADVLRAKTTAPVRVIPSGLDPQALALEKADGDGETVRIGYAASETHHADLAQCANALRRVLRKRPKARLVLKGLTARGVLDTLPQDRVIREPWETFGSAYYPSLAKLAIDVWIAPLVDTKFNRGKAHVKLLESWMLKTPIVCSPVGIYAEIMTDGKEGLFASTQAQWEHALLTLIDHPELRAEMGNTGYGTAEHFTYDKLAPRWVEAFNAATEVKRGRT